MKRIAAATGALVMLLGANAALACAPPRPQTESERVEALWQRQDLGYAQATLIQEFEVVRSWTVQPPGARPPYDGDTHVELRPVRSLRGEGGAGLVEFVHQRFCGYGLSYPTEPGARVLAYSTHAAITGVEDAFELIPVAEITHSATLEALDAP